MSLDFYLMGSGGRKEEVVYFREEGRIVGTSPDEWNRRFPDKEPIVSYSDEEELWWRNITHNLGRMADEAGIYQCLWRPDENGISIARQMIEPLEAGLALLHSDPERFRQLNPSNGWGSYEGLVEFVTECLDACRDHPDAAVSVSR